MHVDVAFDPDPVVAGPDDPVMVTDPAIGEVHRTTAMRLWAPVDMMSPAGCPSVVLSVFFEELGFDR